ncbi:LysM peptidoglycan-binding domain-containing protein [Algibacter amylolyticus]|uniref:LysM peptidoglycan-binding domain-containing protein n=1 Tax=Algibacter amylolyticus TaxID=1608400 RepID=A0A5M7AUW2_9FLAO|nr:LysM peptidoglycan-binding domain-containing protein [Algibacter amylolyticus]KAA5821142.1 LysM peptidoglycan-binding domain-containing protein [Algibacter amylolyticus]MBB5269787.1 LysM repeat protein [Algibacter amylolyticus]TSJ72088.1 LysM peptidoglycan-binding domain-containing protein [Algibacter amylolyticus]
MQKNYKAAFVFIIAFVCNLGLHAQGKVVYKDVLHNGKEAKLNLATGEFIFKDSKGNDSIVNARRNDNDNSIERLNYHVVQQGETLDVVAKQYGLTASKLKQANKLKSSVISEGQKLRVRNFTDVKEGEEADVWVVASGNTLYGISIKTGVSVDALKRLNGLKSNKLAIGQKLFLK